MPNVLYLVKIPLAVFLLFA